MFSEYFLGFWFTNFSFFCAFCGFLVPSNLEIIYPVSGLFVAFQFFFIPLARQ